MRLLTGALVLLFQALVACKTQPDAPETRPPSRADIEPANPRDGGLAAWPGWPDAGKPVTPAMICQVVYAANADLHDSCMRETDPQKGMRPYLDESLLECVPRLERSIINGRASLEEAAAARCITKTMELRRSGRIEIGPNEHACDGAIVGKQGLNAECREEWECAPGLACANLKKTAPGKCMTPPEAGGACVTANIHFDAVPRHCAPGFWCSADRCAARDKEGTFCFPGSCQEGLFCTSGTHRCAKALGKSDSVCKKSEDCELGYYCAIVPNQARCAPQKPAGARCLESIECFGDCRAGKCVSLCGSQ